MLAGRHGQHSMTKLPAATALARLGGLEHRDFTEVPANTAHGTIGQRDGEYLRMTVLLSHRQHQLESWGSAIPAV